LWLPIGVLPGTNTVTPPEAGLYNNVCKLFKPSKKMLSKKMPIIGS